MEEVVFVDPHLDWFLTDGEVAVEQAKARIATMLFRHMRKTGETKKQVAKKLKITTRKLNKILDGDVNLSLVFIGKACDAINEKFSLAIIYQ